MGDGVSAKHSFKVGDLVWAKLKGFSPWPGKVVKAPEFVTKPKKGPCECVFFFGTCNFAYIEVANIKPYLQYKEQLIKAYRTLSFKEAVSQIEKYIDNIKKYGEEVAENDPDAEFNRLRQASPVTSPDEKEKDKEKEKKKKPRKESIKGTKRSSTDAPTERPKKPRSMTDDEPSLSNNISRRGISSILDRPSIIERPPTPQIDIASFSESIRDKQVVPSTLTFGFLGLGIMGSLLVKNFAHAGHKVVVWNRSPNKIKNLESVGVRELQTPSDVATEADIIFCCVSDPIAVKHMVFGNCGLLNVDFSVNKKGYVEMSGVDAETCADVSDAIITKGGRYLEAQIQGSKEEAENGTLVIIASGDRTLYDDCESCFKSIAANSFFLKGAGNATKLNLVFKLMTGIMIAGLAEGMALADRAGIELNDVLDILKSTKLSCPEILQKGKAIIDSTYSTNMPLKHMQKDLRLVLELGDTLEQPLPITSATNEVYKHTKRLGYSDHDVASVYVRARY